MSITSTIAGTGQAKFNDGNSAKASFYYPWGIALDNKGAVLVADTTNHRIRKISGGKVTTLAGSGKAGLADGKGTAAKFYNPQAIVVDSADTTWVADTSNHAIRTIGSDGTVTIIAGSGAAAFKDGKSAVARFNAPAGLEHDNKSTLFISDYGNHRIRKLTKTGSDYEASTLAGGKYGDKDGKGSAAELKRPCGLALGPKGNLFVAEYEGHRLRKVAMDGTVTTIFGNGKGSLDGPLSKAALHYPRDVAVDAAGTIYISDRYNHRIRRVRNGVVDSYAGAVYGHADGADDVARFRYPNAVLVDKTGTLWVADGHNHRIRKVVPSAGSCQKSGVCYGPGLGGCP